MKQMETDHLVSANFENKCLFCSMLKDGLKYRSRSAVQEYLWQALKAAVQLSAGIFWRTEDNVYIFKSIPDFEVECMQDLISDYGQYLEDNPDSLLCRIFMSFRVTADEKTTSAFHFFPLLLRGLDSRRRCRQVEIWTTSTDKWRDL